MSDLFPFVSELDDPTTNIKQDPTIETGYCSIIEDEEFGYSLIHQPDSLIPDLDREPTYDGDAAIRRWEYEVFHGEPTDED